MEYPSKSIFEGLVKEIQKQVEEDSTSDQARFFKGTFSSSNESDLTSVFDYIDDDWFDYTYSNIVKVAEGGYYEGDGTVEYKIAYITVELNLLHKLRDGNKRTSLLVMFILLSTNELFAAIDCDWSTYYKFAKKIASEGNENREANIVELSKILHDQK